MRRREVQEAAAQSKRQEKIKNQVTVLGLQRCRTAKQPEKRGWIHPVVDEWSLAVQIVQVTSPFVYRVACMSGQGGNARSTLSP